MGFVDMMKAKATPQAQENFEVLPAGKYAAIVKSIADWKAKDNKNMKVFEYDEKFHKVKDEAGKDVFSMQDVKSYSAEVVFEITDPKYAGRNVKMWLKLHPNIPWEFPAFLDACGVVEDIFPDAVKRHCVDAEVTLDLIISDKPIKRVNKDTGLDEEVPFIRNEVRKVLPLEIDV